MSNTEAFEDLLRSQEDLAGRIQRYWDNTCKIGKEKFTSAFLEQRKLLLNRYWDTFYNNHQTMIRFKGATESVYIKQDIYGTIEESYLDNMTRLAQIVEEQNTSGSHKPEKASSSSHEPDLPKIDLPKFSGDPLEWESFRDQFKDLVHDSSKLSDVKKMLYLKSCLTGEAANVIKLTANTAAGYQGAWQAVEARYGNPRILSFAHHQRLLTCPVARDQSPTELKRLLDTFQQTISAYGNLKKPVKAWDEWFVYLLSQKLDDVTHLAWKTSLSNSREIPSFSDLALFLENRIQALDPVPRCDPALRYAPSTDHTRVRTKESPSCKKKTTVLSTTTKEKRKCPSCSGSHTLNYCSKFKALSPANRKERAYTLRVCFNCLGSGHDTRKCTSKQFCLACSCHHHTLLHDAFLGEPSTSTMSSTATKPLPSCTGPLTEAGNATATSLAVSAHLRSTALLATARVKLESASGQTIEVRALLDTGSDASLVTEWVAQTLRLRRKAVNVSISGVQDHATGFASSEVTFTLRPRCSSTFRLPVRALVLRRLTSVLPARQVPTLSWPHLNNLTLADPDYGTPARVDLILGADVCASLFQDASRVGPSGTPTARLTPLGWVLMGSTAASASTLEGAVRSYHCQAEDRTDQLLQRFWDVEELTDQQPLSAEEERTEKHFLETHSRDIHGRYVVRLPFQREPTAFLGHSRPLALKLLLSGERRLASNDALKGKYITFMSEYLSLQHMEAVPHTTVQKAAFYLPHHAVLKKHDPAEKVRVVFNASFQTSTGYSLNDCLSVGPKLQADLWMVLSRWRLFRIVFTTDIVKMYRQIHVHPSDVHWQRILWRSRPDDPVQDFALTTVTYGTASAPFLALRVMEQLATDEEHRFPLGAMALRRHRYVDDILVGADTEIQAKALKEQLVGILKAGAFELSKWESNLSEFQDPDARCSRLFHESDELTTLGIKWDPKEDTLSLRIAGSSNPSPVCSKRTILSEIASLFDPLGWAAPVLVSAKILMQDL